MFRKGGNSTTMNQGNRRKVHTTFDEGDWAEMARVGTFGFFHSRSFAVKHQSMAASTVHVTTL
jgi:hypothetical protein